MMTYDEALEDNEPCTLATAKSELKKHQCRVISEGPNNTIQVTNDFDPPEWIDCTPTAILGWLGY